ncbi:hypothetical protein [Alistipes putredinis]|uniref:hypothetical protein n=1 Tax=Alistipes putredinis TaxID=28117 RepID=UPI003AB75C16
MGRAYLGGDILMGDGSWRLSNLTNVGDLEGRHREVRGEWVNYLAGGSDILPDSSGLNVP